MNLNLQVGRHQRVEPIGPQIRRHLRAEPPGPVLPPGHSAQRHPSSAETRRSGPHRPRLALPALRRDHRRPPAGRIAAHRRHQHRPPGGHFHQRRPPSTRFRRHLLVQSALFVSGRPAANLLPPARFAIRSEIEQQLVDATKMDSGPKFSHLPYIRFTYFLELFHLIFLSFQRFWHCIAVLISLLLNKSNVPLSNV